MQGFAPHPTKGVRPLDTHDGQQLMSADGLPADRNNTQSRPTKKRTGKMQKKLKKIYEKVVLKLLQFEKYVL
jgi:hypothetical protein